MWPRFFFTLIPILDLNYVHQAISKNQWEKKLNVEFLSHHGALPGESRRLYSKVILRVSSTCTSGLEVPPSGQSHVRNCLPEKSSTDADVFTIICREQQEVKSGSWWLQLTFWSPDKPEKCGLTMEVWKQWDTKMAILKYGHLFLVVTQGTSTKKALKSANTAVTQWTAIRKRNTSNSW